MHSGGGRRVHTLGERFAAVFLKRSEQFFHVVLLVFLLRVVLTF